MMTLPRVLTILTLLFAGTTSSMAQQSDSSIASLVAAERAFAALTLAKGVDVGFPSYMADEATVLRPGPVNARQWYAEHKDPSLDLRWKPALACVSAAGDLGITSGPYRATAKGDSAGTPAYGSYVTAWKRQADGTWKWVFDFGVSSKEPVFEKEGSVEVLSTFPSKEDHDAGRARGELLRRDSLSLNTDAINRLPGLLDDEVHLLLPAMPPMKGTQQVMSFLHPLHGTVQRTPLHADVASSGDFGYTWGRYRMRGGSEEKWKAGYYFTAWRRDTKGEWKAVVDVEGRGKEESERKQ